MHEIHECNKVFCAICTQNRDIGHLCYMRPLKDVLPITCDKVLSEFFYFETTQNMRFSDKPTLHVPDLACNSFVRGAKMRKTCKTACDAAWVSTRTGTIRSGTCYYNYANRALGQIISS